MKKNSKWKKIKTTDFKSLGELPTEPSRNLQAPETAPADKRVSGRSKKMGLSAKPEFCEKLRRLSFEERRLQIEILEDALKLYEKKKKK